MGFPARLLDADSRGAEVNPLPADLLPLASALTKLLPPPDGCMIVGVGATARAATGIAYVGVKQNGLPVLVADPRDPLLVGQLMEEIRKKYGRNTIDHIAWVRRLLYDLDTETT